MRWKWSMMEGVQLLHVALRQIRNVPRGAEVRQWQWLDEKRPIKEISGLVDTCPEIRRCNR